MKQALLGRFFQDDKQVENFIKLSFATGLLILVSVIVFSLVFNSSSLNVEKNQLIVVVVTTILNSFNNVIYKYFKSYKKPKDGKSES